MSRAEAYCTRYGCFNGPLFRDDVENPWPSLSLSCGALQPDPRVPAQLTLAWCGPFGCGPLQLPMGPARSLQQRHGDWLCELPS
jgi:hypothetical protein